MMLEKFSLQRTAATPRCREHCRKLYGADGLHRALRPSAEKEYNTQNDYYTQFRHFWKGRPCSRERAGRAGPVSVQCLQGFCRAAGPHCRAHGLFCLRLRRRLGLWRAAAAAGIVTEEEFWQKARPLVSAAPTGTTAFWNTQRATCAGACYDMFRGQMAGENRVDKDEMRQYVELEARVLEQTASPAPGRLPPGTSARPKQYKLNPGQLRSVLTGYEGGDKVACIASDRITVDGLPVGYLFREQPLDPNAPDSGWRIFAGDEDADYMADATHFDFFHLNTICNYDASILALLNAPAPVAFRRAGSGWQQEERCSLPRARFPFWRPGIFVGAGGQIYRASSTKKGAQTGVLLDRTPPKG